MDDNLTPLADIARDLKQRATDADWNDNPKASDLWRQYNDVRNRIADGEQYEPKF